MKRCSIFVKEMRRQYGLTQRQLAEKAGVGLRFLRERIDKVNMVLEMFNAELGVVQKEKNVEQ